MLSRILTGARISLVAGVGVTLMAILVGVPVGLTAGLAGGWRDEATMRIVDIFLAFPTLVLGVLVAAVWGGGIGSAMLAAAFVWWPKYARLMRGEALALKNQLYVEAAHAFGASSWRVIRSHILPNAVSPLTVQASLDVGYMIIFAASLSFVGLGAKPPSPEWGLAISTGRHYMPLYWWLSVFPGLAIVITVLGFNLLGDGMRDVLDPKTRRRGY
jgi:peptide/nickel transport system permease protein